VCHSCTSTEEIDVGHMEGSNGSNAGFEAIVGDCLLL